MPITYEVTDATQSATIYRDDRPIGTIQRRRVRASGARFTIYNLDGKKVGVANTLRALESAIRRAFGEVQP